MRKLLRVGYVGLLTIALGGVMAAVGPTTAWAATACTSTIQNTTVSDTVTVPAGASCIILNTTVTGSLVVNSGASITLVGATINGSFTSTGAHDIRMGDCRELGCSAPRASAINGSVSIQGTTGVPSFPSKNVICDATFGGGSVTLQNNAAPFAIGTDPQCFFPGTVRITGNLMLSGNTAAITLTGNQVGGLLQCTNNNPAPTNGGGNTAAVKTGQCSAF